MPLPTNIVNHDPNHAGLHNAVNAAVNDLTAGVGYDSGVRNVESLLVNDFDLAGGGAGRAYLRRIGDRVSLTLFAYIKAGSVSGTYGISKKVLTIPPGFRPFWYAPVGLAYVDNRLAFVSCLAGTDTVEIYAPGTADVWSANSVVIAEVSWMTNNPKPVTLPGLPI